MNLNLYYLLIACLLFSLRSAGQYSDSVFHYTGFTSSGTFNQTVDNSSYLVNNAFKFGLKKKNITLNSNNKWLYGKQNDELTNNDYSSTWDFNLYKTFPHFYYWGLLNYNSSFSLKINQQLQAGVGVAYNVIDRKTLVFNVSDGIIYDFSDIHVDDTTREVYGTPRNSFRLQIKWNIGNKLVFNGNGFLQNSLQDENDYIIKSDLSLSVKLRKWLSLTSTYSYNKMTRTSTENSFLTYGLTIEKYF